MSCNLRFDRWGRRLIVAVGLTAICGCGGADAEYENLHKSRTTAQDALTAQGAQISVERTPVVKTQAFVVDLSRVKNISDETFALLKQLQMGKAVLGINLSGTTISDEQMAKLNDKDVSGLLLRLNLSDTAISDKGLAEIRNMPALMELTLTNTKVTPEGVKAFLKSRAENPEIQAKKTKVKR
jgi:hypothetical protein